MTCLGLKLTMNNHLEAWEHVRKHLFGTVCEVALRTPWGFKEDKADIINVTLDDFLKSNTKYDTILFHIILGEGGDEHKFSQAINKAHDLCVKVVILEHNPNHVDWKGKNLKLFVCPEEHILDNWGRNMLFAYTTFDRLQLEELSDEYVAKHLPVRYVEPHDCGIDKERLIYTHCSESPIDFELPVGTIYWVIGGGLPYESIRAKNYNVLIDSVLAQVLYCARLYGEEEWKLARIWPDVVKINPTTEYLPQGSNKTHWRQIRPTNVKPNEIRHMSLTDVQVTVDGDVVDNTGRPNAIDTVFVSTVHKKYWEHLEGKVNLIDSWTPPRDVPKLRLK